MINNERQQRIFYYLCTKEGYVTSSEISKYLNVSVRTVKDDMTALAPLLPKYGCRLLSKTRLGYRLEIEQMQIYVPARNEIIEHVKYSHTYQYEINNIISVIVKKYLFTTMQFSVNQLADDLYISKEAFMNHFYKLVQQLATFDLSLTPTDVPGTYLLQGREKDIRLLAKDYLIMYIDEIIPHKYDFNSLRWNNQTVDFYVLCHLIMPVLTQAPITFFEVGIYRIICYIYILCFRIDTPIDLKANKVSGYPSIIDYQITDQLIQTITNRYPFLHIESIERLGIALNIMAERDYIRVDVKERTISDDFYHYTVAFVQEMREYPYLHVLKLLPLDTLTVWFLSICAKVLSSTHKQDKPYVFFSDKSVSYSTFSHFLAMIFSSRLKEINGPTMNIYCISYITNCIYTNLMMINPTFSKINIGVYSFLGRLTSSSIITTIRNSNLSHFIRRIEACELTQQPVDYDLLLLHQRSNNLDFESQSTNIVCFDGTGFIDQNVIYAIKSTYIRTSHYARYLNLLECLNTFVMSNTSKFDTILAKYETYQVIRKEKQIIANFNGSCAFLFVQKQNLDIFDVYLLKKKFSYQGNRYRRLFVISVDLTSNDLCYYKAMEAFAQILSRYGLDINFDNKRETIQYLQSAVEKYLTEALL